MSIARKHYSIRADIDRYDLNGREIKNLLRTTLAISRYENVKLSEELIRRVLDLSKEHLLKDDAIANSSLPVTTPLES